MEEALWTAWDTLDVMRSFLAAVVLLLVLAPAASAETLKFRFGPVEVGPGQNTIEFEANDLKPAVDGWITGFKPNLTYADGGVPRVDVVHLHHGVWMSNLRPLFAAGEEKTRIRAPAGFGWRYRDERRLGHEPHDPQPHADGCGGLHRLRARVHPRPRAPEAAGLRELQTIWMDVMGLTAVGLRPCIAAPAGATAATRTRTSGAGAGITGRTAGPCRRTACSSGPPGTCTRAGSGPTSSVERGGRKVRVFRSRAKYFEPAGAVSWDVAMEATPETWRVGVRRGDVLSISATYDAERASWYEAMGIMPVVFDPGGTGPDPFAVDVDVRGAVTHGHLHENRNHGGRDPACRSAAAALGRRRPAAGGDSSTSSTTVGASASPRMSQPRTRR